MIFTLVSIGERSIVISLSVCVSDCEHISETTCSKVNKCLMLDACSCGSVIMARVRYVFVQFSHFAYNGQARSCRKNKNLLSATTPWKKIFRANYDVYSCFFRYIACRRDQYRCLNTGHCVAAATICDGNNNCGDWSDENCTGEQHTVTRNAWQSPTYSPLGAIVSPSNRYLWKHSITDHYTL